jgi:hypothetical protein
MLAPENKSQDELHKDRQRKMADLAADGGEAGIEYEDLDGPCHKTQSNGF